MYTKTKYIADQLKASAPAAEWHSMGVDRADELARILERESVVDLWRIQLVPAQTSTIQLPWMPPVVTNSFALRYETQTFGFLGTPTRHDHTATLELQGVGYLIAWSSEGHGHVNYVVTPKDGGFVFTPVWGSSSDAAMVRQIVLTAAMLFVSFVLPAAGVAVAQTVGAAIIGPTLAASYPGLAAVVGNVAISAAFNGGDIEASVKQAVIGYVGGYAGSAVGSNLQTATGSAMIGKVASAATSAFISGGNVQAAVTQTLIRNGVSSMNEFFPPMSTTPIGGSFFDDWTPTYTDTPPLIEDYYQPLDDGSIPSFYDPFTTTFWGEGFGPAFNGDGSTIPSFQDDPTVPITSPVYSPISFAPFSESFSHPIRVPQPAAADFNPTPIIQGITSAALAALQVMAAYQQVRNPTPIRTARTVASNGAVTVVGSDGMVRTRNPDGTISASKPSAGQPIATVDGNYILNNGDGSYSTVYPDGRSVVTPYTNQSSIGDIFKSPVVMYGGLGLLALLLLRKR